MKSRMNGFTLIELVIVVIVLGILAATAIPKFINLQDDANRSALRGQFGAFESAVKLYHSGWLVAGHSGAVEDLASFGDGDVSSTATGYPYSTSGTGTDAYNACGELWTGITDTSMTIEGLSGDNPSGSPGIDIGFTYSEYPSGDLDTCIYRALHFIQRDQATLTMDYQASSGVVTIRDAGY